MKSIKMSEFGKEHWSTFAYVETLVVDSATRGVGTIDYARMRINPKRHPLLSRNGSGWSSSWGTRLAGYWKDNGKTDPKRLLKSHDDFDCLEDLETAGLVEILSLANGFVRMTDKGLHVAGLLRQWKAKGGHFSGFRHQEPELAKAKVRR